VAENDAGQQLTRDRGRTVVPAEAVRVEHVSETEGAVAALD
jgi:hypothetical protein